MLILDLMCMLIFRTQHLLLDQQRARQAMTLT